MEQQTTTMAAHHDLLLPSRKQKCLKVVQKRKSSSGSLKCVKEGFVCKSSCCCCSGGGGDEEEEDEKVGIERRIMALQRLVPGGESLEIDKLFEETAGYILALQTQVKTMKVLTSIFEGLEKENRKLGG